MKNALFENLDEIDKDIDDAGLPVYRGQEARFILAAHTPVKYKVSMGETIDKMWDENTPSLSALHEKERRKQFAT